MERIKHDEQCIAPRPGIIILPKVIAVDGCQGVGVAGIERVRDGVGVKLLAGIDAQKGLAGTVIEIPAFFLLMIAGRYEDRGRMADQVKLRAPDEVG